MLAYLCGCDGIETSSMLDSNDSSELSYEISDSWSIGITALEYFERFVAALFLSCF